MHDTIDGIEPACVHKHFLRRLDVAALDEFVGAVSD